MLSSENYRSENNCVSKLDDDPKKICVTKLDFERKTSNANFDQIFPHNEYATLEFPAKSKKKSREQNHRSWFLDNPCKIMVHIHQHQDITSPSFAPSSPSPFPLQLFFLVILLLLFLLLILEVVIGSVSRSPPSLFRPEVVDAVGAIAGTAAPPIAQVAAPTRQRSRWTVLKERSV